LSVLLSHSALASQALFPASAPAEGAPLPVKPAGAAQPQRLVAEADGGECPDLELMKDAL
jgi:hypothetical protein